MTLADPQGRTQILQWMKPPHAVSLTVLDKVSAEMDDIKAAFRGTAIDAIAPDFPAAWDVNLIMADTKYYRFIDSLVTTLMLALTQSSKPCCHATLALGSHQFGFCGNPITIDIQSQYAMKCGVYNYATSISDIKTATPHSNSMTVLSSRMVSPAVVP